MSRIRIRVVAVGLPALGALAIALAGPAQAHVTIDAPGAVRGGSDQQITFRVPVEEGKATVALTVQLPTATPIASVDVLPMAGWTHTETTATLATPVKTDDGDITSAVTQISWKATGGGLKPGEYGAFTILAGSLPDVPTLTFKALQTYSDGSVVRWIETPAPGSTTVPQDPAPTLALSRGTSGSTGTAVTTVPKASTTGPTVLAIVALVVAAAAVGLAVVGRVRRREGA